MADESKLGPGTIPTLTDVIRPGKVDSQPLDEHLNESGTRDSTEEHPLLSPESEVGTGTETAEPGPQSAPLSVRPEILPLDEIENEMNPLEATEELPIPDLPAEPETLDDDDQLTDEVPALPLQVAAVVDEILERHLHAAREEIMRQIAVMMDEIDNVSADPED